MKYLDVDNLSWEESAKKIKKYYNDNDLIVISNQDRLCYGIAKGEDLYVFKEDFSISDCTEYNALYSGSYYKHSISDFSKNINYEDCSSFEKLKILREFFIKKVEYIEKKTYTNYEVGDLLLSKNMETYLYIGKKTRLTFKSDNLTHNIKIDTKKHLYLETSNNLKTIIEFKNDDALNIHDISLLKSKKHFFHTLNSISNSFETKLHEYDFKIFLESLFEKRLITHKTFKKIKNIKKDSNIFLGVEFL